MKHLISVMLLLVACGKEATENRRTNADFQGNHSSETYDASPSAAFTSSAGTVQQVETTTGPLRGVLKNNVRVFLGIPYALPPVGERRFKKPEAFPAWSGVRDALTLGAQCPQVEEGDIGSEDCLFLNVFAPGTKTAKNKPVMVFIHGGAFDNGSGYHAKTNDALYDGSKLAALGDVVVVTFNYRLGALGFLAHPALTAAEGFSGNNGILDQILALEWVQKHIKSFGGDPENVTIFGESAGAMSVCTHVAQNFKRGLFKRAVMQSGSCQYKTEADAYAYGESLVKKLGCERDNADDVVSCLRDAHLPAKAFVENQINLDLNEFGEGGDTRLTFAPVVNGQLYTEKPLAVIDSGKGQKVDMIIGSNRYEIPGLLFKNVNTQRDLETYLTASGFNRSEINKLLVLYPLLEHVTHKRRAGAIATDMQFTCPKMEVTRAMLRSGNKVYNYRFDLLGAFHGTELPYLFQTLPLNPHNMAEIGQLWSSFAKSGVPKAGWIGWNASGSKQADLILDSFMLRHESDYRVKQCEVILNAGIIQMQ